LLRSLMSCGPIPLAKVRPPRALAPPLFGGIGDRLYLKQKEKSPRVELGHLLGQCWPAQRPGGPAALAQLRQASWAR
jgi:hypothetical protein